jgi:hypothetical protein
LAEANALLTRANVIKGNYKKGIDSQIAANDTLKKKNGLLLTAAKDTIAKREKKYSANLEKRHTDFVAQFVALWKAAFSDFGTCFLVLMLEIAFLMIEIFPTYQKLRTKVGDYDWAIYYKEKAFEQKMKTEYEAGNGAEAQRLQIETELNSTIYKKIAEVELRVAEKALVEWEKSGTDAPEPR